MAHLGSGDTAGRARLVRLRRGETILLCGKCLKRHKDGKTLRRAVKTQAKASGTATARKPRVVKIGCLGLCPRRAVVVASAVSLSAGEVMVVRDADDVATAVPRLLQARSI